MMNQNFSRAERRHKTISKFIKRLKMNHSLYSSENSSQKDWKELVEKEPRTAGHLKNNFNFFHRKSKAIKIEYKKFINKRKKYPKDLQQMDEEDTELFLNKDWESFCGACDYFQKDECPFKDKVDYLTQYDHIGCKNFWD